MNVRKKSSRRRKSYRPAPKPKGKVNREEGLMKITMWQSVLAVTVIGATVLFNGFGMLSEEFCGEVRETIGRTASPTEFVSSMTDNLSSFGDGYGGELITKVINLYRTPKEVPSGEIPSLPPIQPPAMNSRGYDSNQSSESSKNEIILDGELPMEEEDLTAEPTGADPTLRPTSLLGRYTSIPNIQIAIPDDLLENGIITCDFGFRTHPISGNQDFHTGIDIAAPQGTKITVPFDGEVVHVGKSNAYGNYVEISHGDGIISYYSHCEKILVKEGKKLKKGDVIALVGSTGVSTGPHLHFELMLEGSYIDPSQPLSQRKEL